MLHTNAKVGRRMATAMVVSLAAVSFGLSGCSDDSGASGSEVTNDVGDTHLADTYSPDTHSEADADAGSDDGASDTGDTQMMDARDGSGADAGADTSGDAGSDGPSKGHSGCTYPADQTDSNCTDEDFGDYGPASFVNEFVVTSSGTCCRDFDGDGADDSALGDLVEGLKSFLPYDDVNEEVIAPRIQDGTIVFLFEYAYWSDPSDDPALAFNFLLGEDSDDDFGPNLAGNGEFVIDPTSLDANGDPMSDFGTASVIDGHLSVADGQAPILLPIGTDVVQSEVEDVRIDADVSSGADLHTGGRVELTGGEISGRVTVDQMFSSFNTLSAACGCATTTPTYTKSTDGQWMCNATPADATACEDATQICKILATPAETDPLKNCATVATIVSSVADLDTDGDGTRDAFSLGATFEATGASITGVAP